MHRLNVFALASGLILATLHFPTHALANVEPTLADISTLPGQLEPIDQNLRSRPESLLGRAASLPDSSSDFVYLIVHKQRIHFNFSSPKALYHSLKYENQAYAVDLQQGLGIGHFQVAWKCHASGHQGATGHTGDNGKQIPIDPNNVDQNTINISYSVQMILDGGGMTPAFMDYLDGDLNTSHLVNSELINYGRKTGNLSNSDRQLNILAVAVSQEDCEKVDSFYKSFLASRAYKHFSILADPSKNEGGVCWTTARAAVSSIPVLRDLFSSYVLQFEVSPNLLGQPRFLRANTMYPPQFRPWKIYLDEEVTLQDFKNVTVWSDPYLKGPIYRTFLFEKFQNDFAQSFTSCQNSWCNDLQNGQSRGVPVLAKGYDVQTGSLERFYDLFYVDGRK